MTKQSVWIGFDPRETDAYAVCRRSIQKHLTTPIPTKGIVLEEMRRQGLYSRPTEKRGHQLWDVISKAPMSTQFACSRFLTPILAKSGLAVFMDCDMLVRCNLQELFDQYDGKSAIMCVKHNHEPDYDRKMDDQIQTRYRRKNWSSVVLWNVDHPSNKRLDLKLINTVPGRSLHAFCWLEDSEIGELDVKWNWLAGHSQDCVDPAIVHYTDGVPTMNRETAPFADEWFSELWKWAA